MARSFTRASSEYIEVSSAVLTAVPITIACWFYSDDATVAQAVMGLGSSSEADAFTIRAMGNVANDPLYALSSDNGTWRIATSSSGYTASTWHHACAVFATTTSRFIYIDGGSKVENTQSSTPSAIDSTSIGAYNYGGAHNNTLSGGTAESAIWNAALTDAEVAVLALGYSPLLIRPQSLVFYVPQVRDNDDDIIGGLTLTANGSPGIADHPRIYYPAPTIWVPAPPSGVADLSISESESATPAESVTVDPLLLAGVSETDSATPDESISVSRQEADTRSIAESEDASVSDAATVAPLLLADIVESDAVSVGESTNLEIAYHVTEAESATPDEATTVTTSAPQIAESEAVSVGEADNLELVYHVSETDAISLGESTTVVVSTLEIIEVDAISLGEADTVTVVDADIHTISVGDSAAPTDAITIAVSASQISVSESATPGESVDVDVVAEAPTDLGISVTPSAAAYRIAGVQVVG